MEYEGDGLVALTSKTYICFQNNPDKAGSTEKNIKAASKGLSQRLNQLTKQHYLDVLTTMTNGVGTNKGFRTDGVQILSYEQKRASLSYLYIKRKVDANRVTTTPLDI